MAMTGMVTDGGGGGSKLRCGVCQQKCSWAAL